MEGFVNFINQGWVGAVIGAIGLVFGIYQIFSKHGPKLVFQHLGQNLIEGDGGILPNELSVSYEGRAVPRLSMTKIIIWNSGKSPLRGDAIVAADPLRFSFEGEYEILKAEIEKVTRESNGCRVDVIGSDRSCLECSFEFLDMNDGFLIRIYHTSDQVKPNTSGTIVGVPEGMRHLGRIPPSAYRRRIRLQNTSGSFDAVMAAAVSQVFNSRKLIFSVASLLGLGMAISAFIPSLSSLVYQEVGKRELLTFGLSGAFYFVMSASMLWVERRRFPETLTPNDLMDGKEEPANKLA